MSDLGQSPRVKNLAANIRAAIKDWGGEHRIRLEGLDSADLDMLVLYVGDGVLEHWRDGHLITADEYAQLLELQARRQAELKIPS